MRPPLSIPGLAVVAAALLAGGCGGSAPTATVANVGAASTKTNAGAASARTPSSPATFFSQALKFSQCMRSHGVPDFPDPQQTGHGMSLTLHGRPGSDLNPNSHQFQSSQQACRAYAPSPPANATPNPRLQQQALKFSQCMRSHGVPNFPDPKVSGNTVQLGGPGAQGFNPSSPQFQAAQRACQSSLPGAPGGGGETSVRGAGSAGK